MHTLRAMWSVVQYIIDGDGWDLVGCSVIMRSHQTDVQRPPMAFDLKGPDLV